MFEQAIVHFKWILEICSSIKNLFSIPNKLRIAKGKTSVLIRKWQTTKYGLHFDISNFIGASKKENSQALMSQIQILCTNTSRKMRKLEDVYIISNLTGEKKQLFCDTANSNYVIPSQINLIPPKANFWIRAWFYQPGIDAVEGLYYDDFLRKWGDFSIFIKVKNSEIELKRFRLKDIKRHIDKIFFVNITPIITAR